MRYFSHITEWSEKKEKHIFQRIDHFRSFVLRNDLIIFLSWYFCYFACYMKKYRIEVTEVLSRIVEIAAEDDENALQTVKAMYRNCDLVLDASDYVLTEFRVKDE